MQQLKMKGIFLAVCLFVLAALPVQASDLEQAAELILTKQVGQIEKAVQLLDAHLEQNPQDGEALWLNAKAHLYLGDRVSEDVLSIFERGKSYADRAVGLLPDSPHAHYWQASLIGRIGQTRGILQSLFMVRPMKDALDRVLELDQDYADAYYVLSQLYEQAPGFPLSIGNKKLALETAYKSIELDGENLDYPVQLARALRQNGQRGEAVQVLKELLARPETQGDPEIKADAEELLAELEGR